MQRILVVFLVFICATANAQVFRRVGPDGQVYFSDRPGPDAEQIEVTPAQAVTLPAVPEVTPAAEQEGDAATEQEAEISAAYSLFTIISPVRDQAIRANDGNVTVHLMLQPELRNGHTIALLIDGEDGRNTSVAEDMSVELTNLSRGLHSIEAAVFDAGGNELIRTEPVSFNVLRIVPGR